MRDRRAIRPISNSYFDYLVVEIFERRFCENFFVKRNFVAIDGNLRNSPAKLQIFEKSVSKREPDLIGDLLALL